MSRKIKHKALHITHTQMAIATAFLGAALFVAAAAGLSVEPDSTRSVTNSNRGFTVPSLTRNANKDLSADSIMFNHTKNFVDYDTYPVDVLSVDYRNVGPSTIKEPFNIKLTFSSPVPLTVREDRLGNIYPVRGIYHIMGDSEYSINPDDQKQPMTNGVFPGEGSVTITNTIEEIFPHNDSFTEFIIPVTRSKEDNADLSYSIVNLYELEPGEMGEISIIVPKFVTEFMPDGVTITVEIDSDNDIKEFTEINNTRELQLSADELGSNIVYCQNFGACSPSAYGACATQNTYQTLSACEAAL